MLSYADIQARLSHSERLRLQKLLHIILPREKPPSLLRCFLKESYARLGLSTAELRSQGLWPSFVKLLDFYGFLTRSSLDLDEQRALEKNPYTIWPNKDHCVLNADALDFLCSQSDVRKKNYLCFALQKLSSREKKSWCKWLGINAPVSSERERTLALYRRLARLNCSKEETLPQQLPEFLDEVFPDDLALSPVAWFYRGVLTFYRSLEETEKKIQELSPLARTLLPFFKKGSLLISAIPLDESSQSLGWRIVRTKEKFVLEDCFAPFFESCVEEKKEGILF